MQEPVYENPIEKIKFDVEKLGTGWYKAKTTSKTGKLRYAWIRVTSISDKLKSPAITLSPLTPNGENNWYKSEVEVTIASNDKNAKEIRYMLISGETINTGIDESDVMAGNKYEGPFKISVQGFTRILAWIVEKNEEYRSEYAKEEIKIDSHVPNIIGIITEPDRADGEGGWFKTKDIEIQIDANDQNEEGNEGSGIDKYYYLKGTDWIETENGKLPKIENEGIIGIAVKTIDKAGNEMTSTVNIKIDSTPPEFNMDPKIQIQNKTARGFTVLAVATDKKPGSTDEIKPDSENQKKQITYKCYYTKIEEGKTNEKIEVDKDIENTTGRFVITGLETNAIYDVEVVAKDPAGNQTAITTSTQTTGELKKPTINVTSANGTSRILDGITYYNKDNGNITVTIKDQAEDSTSATRICYKITDKNGNEIEGTGSIPTTTITTAEYNFPIDGTYKIEAWVEDENITEGQERKKIRNM